MTEPSATVPEAVPWTVSIHAGAKRDPIGTGVVITDTRVLTCAHVVLEESGDIRKQILVRFPKAGLPFATTRTVVEVVLGEPPDIIDAAILTLAEPVPAEVIPARLRCPAGAELRTLRWWAFGFPNDVRGNSANGVVGEDLGWGWIRLDTDSAYLIEKGFSGCGLWSPDYDAVVGLVGTARSTGEHRGDGQALTLAQIDRERPDEKLGELATWTPTAAGEDALAAWGWHLATDPEAGRHWKPRARGVSRDCDQGYRFQGRTAALTEIVAWLDRPTPDLRVLVVTGLPGVGKSAVLGRIVTTADAGICAVLPADDTAVRATLGSVACAVHAKGKTAHEIAREIARATSAALPDRPEDLAPAVRTKLIDHPRRCNIIIDALDEASTPAEARTVIRELVLPLASIGADTSVQVVVGTRRRDNDGDLLGWFGQAAAVIDLDADDYFVVEDLQAYALATLRLVGAERPRNPYEPLAVARPVATRIAELAHRNFLVAGLIARTHGQYDQEPIPLDRITFDADVDMALASFLARMAAVGTAPASLALTVLAYAEAPGLPLELWASGLAALGAAVTEDDLRMFARTSAANFLIESTGDGGHRSYRLFHQALNDALLRGREDLGAIGADEARLIQTWLVQGKATGWAQAPEYLLRFLGVHAGRAGVVDRLLAEDQYLLYADLLRLIPSADQARTKQGRARAAMLRLTVYAAGATAAQRAGMYSVTTDLDQLDTGWAAPIGAPYCSRWARATPRHERALLEGHTDWVSAVCSVEVNGRLLLASGGADRTVRLWDPITGVVQRVLEGHTGWVNAVCSVEVSGRVLLVSGGADRTVRLWDPTTGVGERVLDGHTDGINAVCSIQVDGRVLLASGGADRTVRLWDPITGAAQPVLRSHNWEVNAMCSIEAGGRTLLVSASDDRTVRLWDPTTGASQRVLKGHTDGVRAVCPVDVNGRVLLASAGADQTVRLWDPTTGVVQRVLEGHTGWVNAVYPVEVNEQRLLVSAGADRTVRLWDLSSGASERVLEGHTEGINAVCSVEVNRQTLLASGGADRTVRLWDPTCRAGRRILDGHIGGVRAVCSVEVDGRVLLASGGADRTVRLWDSSTGAAQRILKGHTSGVRAVCPVEVDGRVLLASGGIDRTVRLRDLSSRTGQRILKGHTGWVNAVCPVEVGGWVLLASGGADRTVRLWDPATGASERVLEGHAGWVNAVCSVEVGGRVLLASASDDRTVRLWDSTTGATQCVLEGHASGVNAVCPVEVGGRVLLASGGADRTVRLWDPTTGANERVLEGHADGVNGVCSVEVGGRALLASVSHDRTLRLWNPSTGRLHYTIPTHHCGFDCAVLEKGLVVALDRGVIVIDIFE